PERGPGIAYSRSVRIAVIVNRRAGTVVSEGLDAEALQRIFRNAGVEADVRLLPGEEIEAATREAVAGGAEVVVAGGGDGTIRTVASVLVEERVPMGVLPVGTLNHFARDLGIPTELPEAVRVLVTGTVRALDVAEVNGEVFVNNSILGFYPPVVRVRDWQRRRLERGKWWATLTAAFKVLPKLPSLHVRLKADGLEIDHKTRFVFVGNNEYEFHAFRYGARCRFDSGSLYIYIDKSRTRLGLLAVALLGLVRDVKRTDRFERWQLPELTIETRKKAVPVYLDGEVTVMNPPLRYRTRPLALRVLLPSSGT
ncbi:MAG TPA: diacylglycerol kinase family protein, partial [Thermoanaerobaculia bacterium]|nr:diacylglycerol kinase family protein [Thermoanaerobaculia bacterium]